MRLGNHENDDQSKDAANAAQRGVDMGLHEKQRTRQATGCKISMTNIFEHREGTRARSGDAIDNRQAHDIVLRDGPVPLQILEENVEAWMAAQS